jgi:hypothetical protein
LDVTYLLIPVPVTVPLIVVVLLELRVVNDPGFGVLCPIGVLSIADTLTDP